MNFSKLNKEDAIRRFMNGELNSEDHIAVGDLIRENSDWKIVFDRYKRGHTQTTTEFGTTEFGTDLSRNQQNTQTTPTPYPTQKPSGQTGEGWLPKFLKGYAPWIILFILFRFGSCMLEKVKELKGQLRGIQSEQARPSRFIFDDLTMRYSNPEDSLAHLIPLCADQLAKAEKYYADGRNQRYLEALTEVCFDESSPCQSEALYLAAEAALAAGDTELSLSLLSKVSDLDHFGADMQWTMAKIFYSMAQNGELEQSKAKRAIDKALAFPENQKHLNEANEMLSQLGDSL
jgi:hypothetical protein